MVERFISHVNVDPWNWTPALVEEFSADLRTQKHVAHSTLRGYHSALRAFTSYISNPDYGFDVVCERFFGTHPAQVFFDWNTAPHVQEYDGRPKKRPYTREEISQLFDHADDEVERIGKSGRKGWQAAYRDAVMMKVAYGYGLRFNELRHLQTVDFARNPHAREFGAFGVCKVRYGKAKRSSPHKPRSVLTVWRWTPGILEDWLANGRGDPGTLDLFPSERGGLVVESTLIRRVRRYCEELGFSDGLDLHSFRRSYATHLLEAGWDPRWSSRPGSPPRSASRTRAGRAPRCGAAPATPFGPAHRARDQSSPGPAAPRGGRPAPAPRPPAWSVAGRSGVVRSDHAALPHPPRGSV